MYIIVIIIKITIFNITHYQIIIFILYFKKIAWMLIIMQWEIIHENSLFKFLWNKAFLRPV